MKYRVDYEFMILDPDITDGKWHQDFLDNNGAGFTFEEAEHCACELRASQYIDCRWAEVTEM